MKSLLLGALCLKLSLTLLVIMTVCSGCASKTVIQSTTIQVEVVPQEPDMTGVIAMIGLPGWGHACGIRDLDGSTGVYTARHLIEDEREPGEAKFFMWEDRSVPPKQGRASTKYVDPYVDLGAVNTQGDEPHYYMRALYPPQKGEEVWWVEFDDEIMHTMLDVTKKAKVLHVRAGYIITDKAPNYGGSGSCMINAASQVVGIIVWRHIEGTKGVGASTLVSKYSR